MGLLDFGVGDIVQGAAKIIGLFVEDPTEKAKALAKLNEMQHDELMAQLDMDKSIAVSQSQTNTAEASSGNLFVAGWRPMVGWVCGAAYAYTFVIQPFLTFILAAFGRTVATPVLSMADLVPVLFGMLGLGAMRSYDKKNGVAK